MSVGRSILSLLDLVADRPQITLASLQIRVDDAELLLDFFEFERIAINSLCQFLNIVFGLGLTDFGFRDGVIGEIE